MTLYLPGSINTKPKVLPSLMNIWDGGHFLVHTLLEKRSLAGKLLLSNSLELCKQKDSRNFEHDIKFL
jgi:hypothetical protein